MSKCHDIILKHTCNTLLSYWLPQLQNCSFANEFNYRSCFHCCSKYTFQARRNKDPLLTSPADGKKPQQMNTDYIQHLPKELVVLRLKLNNVPFCSLAGRTLQAKRIQSTSFKSSSAYSLHVSDPL